MVTKETECIATQGWFRTQGKLDGTSKNTGSAKSRTETRTATQMRDVISLCGNRCYSKRNSAVSGRISILLVNSSQDHHNSVLIIKISCNLKF